MDKIKINDIGKYKDQTVQLDGWIYNSRRSGKIGFLMFRDGFGLLQCIIEKSHIGEIKFEEFKKLTQETSIKIIGSGQASDTLSLHHRKYLHRLPAIKIAAYP